MGLAVLVGKAGDFISKFFPAEQDDIDMASAIELYTSWEADKEKAKQEGRPEPRAPFGQQMIEAVEWVKPSGSATKALVEVSAIPSNPLNYNGGMDPPRDLLFGVKVILSRWAEAENEISANAGFQLAA